MDEAPGEIGLADPADYTAYGILVDADGVAHFTQSGLTAEKIKDVVARVNGGEEPFPAETYKHVEVLRAARRYLKKWRKRLWIPANWDIELHIFCHTEDTDGHLGSCDWGYRPNAHFAIQLRCDLSDAELEWVLVHELLEAMLSEYGDFCINLFDRAESEPWRDQVDRDHRRIRDALIEHFLHAFFGKHSPARYAEYTSIPAAG